MKKASSSPVLAQPQRRERERELPPRLNLESPANRLNSHPGSTLAESGEVPPSAVRTAWVLDSPHRASQEEIDTCPAPPEEIEDAPEPLPLVRTPTPGTLFAQLAAEVNLSQNNTWDDDSQSHSFAATTGRLNCTHGPHGITSISIASEMAAAEMSHAQAASSFAGTFSSSKAIKGSRFSWVQGDLLGHGSLGSVFKALDQRTGQMIAVKEVRIDRKLDTDMKLKNALENEVGLYKELQHPHIVSYFGHDYIDNSLYIYLEYMPGGSVAQVLSQFGPFDESLIVSYAVGLLEGLDYLHSRDPVVLHRDIKGANILVGIDCRVKLSDFGCSKRAADTMSQSLKGSVPWMAPEVIQQAGQGRRSDVWSFGCVIIEMATAKHPWGNFDNPIAAMLHIGMSDKTPPLPEHLSNACRSFIEACTQRDKNKRPQADELLKHPFVVDFSSRPPD
jgi:hypothetical protein